MTDGIAQSLTASSDDIPAYQVSERVALPYSYNTGEPIFGYDYSATVVSMSAALAKTAVKALGVADV